MTPVVSAEIAWVEAGIGAKIAEILPMVTKAANGQRRGEGRGMRQT